MVNRLEILQIDASDMDNYAYLAYCPTTGKGVAIDPSLHPERLLSIAKEHEIDLILLLNTHGHGDHIAGNRQIIETTGVKLAAHPADLPQADQPLADGDEITVGQGKIKVLHTPGHSPGSLVFQTDAALITGDTLFVSRCGRADLPGSRVEDLYRSLQRLKQLPGALRIYPGHNYGPTPNSTLSWELEHNPYLQCEDLDSFIKLRMG